MNNILKNEPIGKKFTRLLKEHNVKFGEQANTFKIMCEKKNNCQEIVRVLSKQRKQIFERICEENKLVNNNCRKQVCCETCLVTMIKKEFDKL